MSAVRESRLELGAAGGRLDARWRQALVTLALALAVLAVLYFETLASIVGLWWESESYNHGFVILPISAYLIYQQRAAVLSLTPRPDYAGAVILVALVALWLIAEAVNVQLGKHVALVAMIPVLVWTLLGRRVATAILFPLLYLLFMVPMGERLVPTLQAFTAWFTVLALRASGIAVFWQDIFFSTSVGHFEVAKACSGIRYLITSVALGFVYAYLSYRSYWRRGVFVALSVVVPIFANGLRAYGIVVLAHASDMKLAIGFDHIIYGWVFFGVVMLLLFWVGSLFREPGVEPARRSETARSSADEPSASPQRARRLATAPLLLVAAALAAGPAWAYWARSADLAAGGDVVLPAIDGIAGPGAPFTEWHPDFKRSSGEALGSYTLDGRRYQAFVAVYRAQAQGAELISDDNFFYNRKMWRTLERKTPLALAGTPQAFTVAEFTLRFGEQRLLMWHWYEVGGQRTSSNVLAKLYELGVFLRGAGGASAALALATPMGENAAEARQRLAAFLQRAHPALSGVVR